MTPNTHTQKMFEMKNSKHKKILKIETHTKNKPRLSPKPELKTKHKNTLDRLNGGKKTNPDSATED